MQKDNRNVHIFQAQTLISVFFSNFNCQKTFPVEGFSVKKMVAQGYFLKKWKLCMQNLTKGQKQPPTVILQQVIFTIYLSSACG